MSSDVAKQGAVSSAPNQDAPKQDAPKRGKRYTDALAGYERDRNYEVAEALELTKSIGATKFDQTVELVAKLGVDPRKQEQMLRGTVNLPAGTGKNTRIAVFAQGPAAQEAKDAGADRVGDEDLVKAMQDGELDFDVVIAQPSMMAMVGKLGKLLGTKGLMPNPKVGTVTDDIGKAVTDFKGGKVSYRTDKFGNVHIPIGKVSFDSHALVENFEAVVDELQRSKPAASKGRFFQKLCVSSTMGPSVKIDTSALR